MLPKGPSSTQYNGLKKKKKSKHIVVTFQKTKDKIKIRICSGEGEDGYKTRPCIVMEMDFLTTALKARK